MPAPINNNPQTLFESNLNRSQFKHFSEPLVFTFTFSDSSPFSESCQRSYVTLQENPLGDLFLKHLTSKESLQNPGHSIDHFNFSALIKELDTLIKEIKENPNTYRSAPKARQTPPPKPNYFRRDPFSNRSHTQAPPPAAEARAPASAASSFTTFDEAVTYLDSVTDSFKGTPKYEAACIKVLGLDPKDTSERKKK